MSFLFTKMHGALNDFIVIDRRTDTTPLDLSKIESWADRRAGIGFDQLLVLEPPRDKGADVMMRVYNADGAEASQCGNGLRCVASYITRGTDRTTCVIETANRIHHATIHSETDVTVNIGAPAWDWAAIPLAKPMDTLHLDLSYGGLFDPSAVSMGNPHLVFFVNQLDDIPLETLGPVLEVHPLFPKRTNVEIAQRLAPDHIKMRVWERGAGITLACGSGACAVFAAAHARGMCQNEVTMSLEGGDFHLKWLENGEIEMRGPVAFVYQGTIE